MNQGTHDASREAAKSIGPFHVPEGPITRQRAKRIKEAAAELAQSYMAECDRQLEGTLVPLEGFNGVGSKMFHLAQIIED